MKKYNYAKAVILASSILWVLYFIALNVVPSNSRAIDVAFRFDDAFAYGKADVSQAVLEIFKDAEAPVTIGLIPKSFNIEYKTAVSQTMYDNQLTKPGSISEEIKQVLRWSGYDVFMHGLTHANTGAGEEIGILKVPGVVLESRTFLENVTGKEVRGYIPPWNQISQASLAVLESSGFKIVSFSSKNRYPVRDSRLSKVNTHLNLNLFVALYRGKNRLRATFENGSVVIMLHPYNFFESGDSRAFIDLNEFRGMLRLLQRDHKVSRLSDFNDNSMVNEARLLNAYITRIIPEKAVPTVLRAYSSTYFILYTKLLIFLLCASGVILAFSRLVQFLQGKFK